MLLSYTFQSNKPYLRRESLQFADAQGQRFTASGQSMTVLLNGTHAEKGRGETRERGTMGLKDEKMRM